MLGFSRASESAPKGAHYDGMQGNAVVGSGFSRTLEDRINHEITKIHEVDHLEVAFVSFVFFVVRVVELGFSRA
ncbi:MAG: hypothetical protein HOP16_15215 [Acidobacteria bacterium]|nr:hypothetical protein [Acidobacteriota bacterium]